MRFLIRLNVSPICIRIVSSRLCDLPVISPLCCTPGGQPLLSISYVALKTTRLQR